MRSWGGVQVCAMRGAALPQACPRAAQHLAPPALTAAAARPLCTPSLAAGVFLQGGTKCSIYGARPMQCSTYPWWPELMDPGAAACGVWGGEACQTFQQPHLVGRWATQVWQSCSWMPVLLPGKLAAACPCLRPSGSRPPRGNHSVIPGRSHCPRPPSHPLPAAAWVAEGAAVCEGIEHETALPVAAAEKAAVLAAATAYFTEQLVAAEAGRRSRKPQ